MDLLTWTEEYLRKVTEGLENCTGFPRITMSRTEREQRENSENRSLKGLMNSGTSIVLGEDKVEGYTEVCRS